MIPNFSYIRQCERCGFFEVGDFITAAERLTRAHKKPPSACEAMFEQMAADRWSIFMGKRCMCPECSLKHASAMDAGGV